MGDGSGRVVEVTRQDAYLLIYGGFARMCKDYCDDMWALNVAECERTGERGPLGRLWQAAHSGVHQKGLTKQSITRGASCGGNAFFCPLAAVAPVAKKKTR